MNSEGWLIYGATGFTGRLLATAAARRGLRPILVARDGARVAALGRELGLSVRAGTLDGHDLDRVLADVSLVVHAAGPYAQTAAPMVDACLRAGAHYLDLSGELPAILAVAARDSVARARRLMLLPSIGFDVVATNCLTAHVAGRVRSPRRLHIGISGLDLISRGSARSTTLEFGRPTQVRRGGVLVDLPTAPLRRDFDYGRGPSPSVAVSWADLVAGWYTTGIPDIDVYVEETAAVRWLGAASRNLGWARDVPVVRSWLDLQASALPSGPTAAQRAGRQAVVVAEIQSAGRATARARLITPEVYEFTAETALAIVTRVLRGDFEPGFQTPARVYGADFVMTLPGVRRADIDDA